MTLPEFLLSLALVARATRFITADTLAEPFRVWVGRRWGWESLPRELVGCPWCMSVWVAAVVVPVAWVAGDTAWFQIPAYVAAASYLYSLAATNLDGD